MAIYLYIQRLVDRYQGIRSICLLSTSIQTITLSAFHCNFSKYIEMFSFSSGVKTSIAKIIHFNLNKMKTIAFHSNPIITQFRASDSHIPIKKSLELRFFSNEKKLLIFSHDRIEAHNMNKYPFGNVLIDIYANK